MYAIPDFVSLLLEKKISITATVHHIVICIMNYWSCQNDYQQENICRSILVYVMFSALTYLVNLLLAVNKLKNSSRQEFVLLAILSLVIFALTCTINWTWQVYYIHRVITLTNHWSIYIYCVLLSDLIYDDLVLMEWLWSLVNKYLNPSSS